MKSTNPLFSAIQSAGMEMVGGLMIGMPGHVVAYYPSTQRAQIECGIQRQMSDGTVQTLPLLVNVPVQFPGSADWSVFHELPAGTEGYIHFSQRSVDAWLDMGGPAPPTGPEMFSASDAFFSPGYRSLKTAIPDLPTSGIGMSNSAGTVTIHLTDKGVRLTADGQTLELTSSGLVHNGTNIGSDHIHSGVERGGGNTNGPQ
ncbi:Gp138 family membrane-puncturing spike protein [Brenneria uluponensis]|uniref:Gp138 family membrane-puncturing spike protein n=1 Tax=Brenneria uluponensis TaxID=3057057 RepID=UPI0028E4C551|nr:Gp138 family membrane-puncturing spike protein [Brenneria ulupoensis]